MRKAILRALSAVIIPAGLASISGCGLEYYSLLNPPNPIYGTSTDGTFQFSAGSANNEFEFLGFELYYKFYRPVLDSPENSINTFEELQTKSFRRLNNAGSDTINSRSKPLFWSEAFKGTTYTVTIDFFTDPGNPTVSATVTPQREITGLLRGVDALPPPYDSLFKPFYNYEIADEDITPDIYNSYIIPGLPVTLVLYVLSYGKDSTGLELYSQPIYLGDKLLTFPNRTYP
jgi:hypothetical protein